MAKANLGLPPSKDELRLRFGCGALLGMLIGALLAFEFTPQDRIVTIAAVLGGALLIGTLARHLGNVLWHAIMGVAAAMLRWRHRR